jgi:hypothetical protein
VWTIAGRHAMLRAVERAKEGEARAGAQIDLALDDKRTLQGDVDAGRITLQVYVCPECSARISDQSVKNRAWPPRCFECNNLDPMKQTLMDGKPMVSTEIPVRKLPDAFRHVDSVLTNGIDERYVRRLVREIENQKQAMVPAAHVGFPANARVLLRFAASRAGVDYNAGAVRELGEGQDVRVHFYVDPTEGVGAT